MKTPKFFESKKHEEQKHVKESHPNTAIRKYLPKVLFLAVFMIIAYGGIVMATGGTNTIVGPGNVTTSQWYSGTTNVTDVLNYPIQPAVYIIFQQGSVTYAKNCQTGTIDFSGLNSSIIINAVTSTLIKGTIEINSGSYNISSPILLYSDQTLEGDGIGSTVLIATSNATNVIQNGNTALGSAFIVIKDLQIGSPNGGYFGNDGIHLVNASDSYIINCRIYLLSHNGIYVDNGYQIRVDSCLVSGCINEAFYGGVNVQNGIYLSNSVFETSLNTPDITIMGGYVHHIINCHMERGSTNAISFSGGYSQICNNYLSGSTGGGMYIAGAFNNIAGNTIVSATGWGITLESVKNSAIIGNILINDTYGIVVTSVSDNSTISGNTISHGNIEAYGGNYLTITGNNVAGNIHLETNYNVVSGNTIRGSFSETTHTNLINDNFGFLTQASGYTANTTATTFTILHGLGGAANIFVASFNTVAVSGYSWTTPNDYSVIVTVNNTYPLPSNYTCFWVAINTP
jgi:parallel beta-helix repeat protein